jgi:radical SAM protein with 4Fe4S-binding SPASM domain
VFRTAGVSDGKGFVFVSHLGDIYPSGFPPVYGGNVRKDSLVEVYRNSGLFQILRDTTAREGKCGICEYHKICGGSRSRAYWNTGNYMAEDPRLRLSANGRPGRSAIRQLVLRRLGWCNQAISGLSFAIIVLG